MSPQVTQMKKILVQDQGQEDLKECTILAKKVLRTI